MVGLAPFYAPFESTNEKTKEIEGFDVEALTRRQQAALAEAGL